MASIHKTATGYQLIWREAGRQRSKRYPAGLTAKQRDRIVADKEREIDSGEQLAAEARETVAGYAAEWLALRRPDLAPYSYKSYEGYVRLYIAPGLGAVRLADLRKTHVEALQRRVSLALSPKTAHNVMAFFRTVCKAAWQDEKIAKNYAELVPLPKIPKRQAESFDADQLAALLPYCHVAPYGPMCAVESLAGLRPGEVAGLWTTDVDMARRTLRVQRQAQPVKGQGMTIRQTTKTDAGRRVVVFPRALLPYLEAAFSHRERLGLKGDGPLFTTAQGRGRPISANKAWKGVKAIMAAAGLGDVRPYALRHSFGSTAVAAGADLKKVSVAMGHEDTVITERRYVHVRDRDDYTSAVADALDAALGVAL